MRHEDFVLVALAANALVNGLESIWKMISSSRMQWIPAKTFEAFVPVRP